MDKVVTIRSVVNFAIAALILDWAFFLLGVASTTELAWTWGIHWYSGPVEWSFDYMVSPQGFKDTLRESGLIILFPAAVSITAYARTIVRGPEY